MVVEEAELDAAVQSLNGKTDVFQARIEECQRALAPWMEKSNDKKSQIDVAKAESDLIEEKRRGAQRAVEVAEGECEELKLKGIEKVGLRERLGRGYQFRLPMNGVHTCTSWDYRKKRRRSSACRSRQ